MNLSDINEDNFLLFAIRNHNNPEALTDQDLLNDLKLFRTFKSHLKKFLKTNSHQKFNLCINDIIHIHNIFGEASVILIFFIIENEYYPYIKTFLKCLNFLPNEVEESLKKIPYDPTIKNFFEAI